MEKREGAGGKWEGEQREKRGKKSILPFFRMRDDVALRAARNSPGLGTLILSLLAESFSLWGSVLFIWWPGEGRPCAANFLPATYTCIGVKRRPAPTGEKAAGPSPDARAGLSRADSDDKCATFPSDRR